MIIGLSYDLKDGMILPEGQPDDALEEYDSAETVEGLKKAIELKGHSVVDLGGGRAFLENLMSRPVDLVFNISEGLGCYRSREAQIPSILEMMGIPYTGSDPQTLAISLDKHLTKKILSAEGIKTPDWLIIGENGKRPNLSLLKYPVFVKPAFEGSSKGVRFTSFVENKIRMNEVVLELTNHYRQPVMVEEYVDGHEITVGVIGNDAPVVLGVMRIVPITEQSNFIYTLEVKRNYEKLVYYECPAKLDRHILQEIKRASLRIYKILGCRDFARIDFRVDKSGVPYFIEINPLPGLNPRSSDLVIMARLRSISYNRLVGMILESAVKRIENAAQSSSGLQSAAVPAW
jgi:D-alanine-D-alanine ligase